MPTVKTIPLYNTQSLINCTLYVEDEKKTVISKFEDGRQVATDIDSKGEILFRGLNGIDVSDYEKDNIMDALEYVKNQEKTLLSFDGEKNLLVSGFNTTPETAVFDMEELKQQYILSLRKKGIDPSSRVFGKRKDGTNKQSRDAYHLIMSFAEIEGLSPRLVHSIGLEFCEKALGDTCAVVSTHMNTDNLHNHIVFSAYKKDQELKYSDTLEQLEQLRAISDEIAIKYGIDIIIDREVADKKGHSYEETQAIKKGTSWKEEMKNVIRECQKKAHSWDEFTTEMLKEGYSIDDNPNRKNVVYYKGDISKNNKHRARATTLGQDFTKAFLQYSFGEITEAEYLRTLDDSKEGKIHKANFQQAQAFKKMPDKNKDYQPRKGLNIYVARYTPTGRRRSDLELLFLGAKKVIEHYAGKNTSVYRAEPDKYPKANQLLDTADRFDKIAKANRIKNSAIGFYLNQPDLLNNQIRDLYKEIATKKGYREQMMKNITTSNVENKKVDEILDLRKQLNARGIDDLDFHLLSFSDMDIRKNRAKLSPLTNVQRKEIYQKLTGSGFALDCKFYELSFNEGKQLLDFFNKKTAEKPAFLLTQDEARLVKNKPYLESTKSKMLEADRNRLRGKELTEKQLGLLQKVASTNPEIDITKVKDAFDFQQIIDYYSPKNPLAEHIEGEPLKPIHKKNLEILCELCDFELIAPIDSISEAEYKKVLKNLLYRTEKPECLSMDITNERRNLLFDKEIEGLSGDDKALLYKYRNKMIELNKLGITEDNLVDVPANFNAITKETNEVDKDLVYLGNKLSFLLKTKEEIDEAVSILNDPKLEQNFAIVRTNDKEVSKEPVEAVPFKERYVRKNTEPVKEEPKAVVPTPSDKSAKQPHTEPVKVDTIKSTPPVKAVNELKIQVAEATENKPSVSVKEPASVKPTSPVKDEPKAVVPTPSDKSVKQPHTEPIKVETVKSTTPPVKAVNEPKIQVTEAITENEIKKPEKAFKRNGEVFAFDNIFKAYVDTKLMTFNISCIEKDVCISTPYGKRNIAQSPDYTTFEGTDPIVEYVERMVNHNIPLEYMSVEISEELEKVKEETKTLLDKDGVTAILSEDGLRLTFENNNDEEVAIYNPEVNKTLDLDENTPFLILNPYFGEFEYEIDYKEVVDKLTTALSSCNTDIELRTLEDKIKEMQKEGFDKGYIKKSLIDEGYTYSDIQKIIEQPNIQSLV